MPDHRRHFPVTKRRHHAQRIAHQIGQAKWRQRSIVFRIAARGPAIAALIRRHHVIPHRRQGQHHMPPGISEFRKAMQQQQARPARRFMPGFQHMHPQPIDAFKKAGADALRQGW